MNKCYLIDCMDFMKDKPDNYYDLAICDIQYGINKGGKIGGEKPFGKNIDRKNTRGTIIKAKNYKDYGDKKTMSKEYHIELDRITKHRIMFGANHFISKMPFDSSCWIVWDKRNSGDFADCELAWTNFNTAVRIFKYRWNGMLQENMKNKEYRIHGNQKPVALYKWLLTNYAKPDYKLLDTHSGSGSFRIAAYDMGFDLDSCELDKDYFDANEKRFQDHIQQNDLFKKSEYQDLLYKD